VTQVDALHGSGGSCRGSERGECGREGGSWLTCMLSSSVRHDVQQETCIVEAAAVEVDIRCTAHERIVFLCEKAVRGNKYE
jgi:hypothetical protein